MKEKIMCLWCGRNEKQIVADSSWKNCMLCSRLHDNLKKERLEKLLLQLSTKITTGYFGPKHKAELLLALEEIREMI